MRKEGKGDNIVLMHGGYSASQMSCCRGVCVGRGGRRGPRAAWGTHEVDDLMELAAAKVEELMNVSGLGMLPTLFWGTRHGGAGEKRCASAPERVA